MASDRLEAELARLLGEIAALVSREPRVTLVVGSSGPRGDGELVATGDAPHPAASAIERPAGRPGGVAGEAERLRAALEATADRLAQAAARFERLGLDAAAATVRVVERDARDALRKLRADREGGGRSERGPAA
jgi:hypothetical protein